MTNFIPYKMGDPTDLDSYQGQETLKKRLKLRINAMKPGDHFRALLYAPAGQGKTALVRVLAKELLRKGLAANYFETIAGKFDTKSQLDGFMKRIPAYSIIFIDEIHGLPNSVRDALYPAIQDNVYAFDDSDTVRELPVGLHWIGATTDLGKVHPAMQRRLIPVALEPLTVADKAWIALLQPRTIEVEAALEMANRCWSPWEIKDELYATAADVATEKQSWNITLENVLEACGLLGIDENGLRPKERLVLETLHSNPKMIKNEVRYVMAKAPLITIVGVDEPTFTAAIEPKLLRLGYLRVHGGGRELTAKALKDYFDAQKP